MKIVRHAPITRGVTELMYVGDDGAEAERPLMNTQSKVLMAASIAGGLLAIFGKTKTTKYIGAALSFGAVGVELYLHSQGTCVMDL